ncbi:hypothetical protein [Rhodanobacter sp. DHG33]|uniref:hypothetical protein n=1 Tax=Rhodanobacter sp. DHG33 TaxID=2775921 RepID=UPI00177FE66D|nr:hypothetical protein [Rhodanobacter sp. DHG33]MBD8897753.1 hypothetical protein [Rhodanobacter sp. DHG33]
MNKIFALTLAMAFAGMAHAQTPVHPTKGAVVVNKASIPAQNAQGKASTTTGIPANGNAVAPRKNVLTCVPANAPASATNTPCHPTKTAQL